MTPKDHKSPPACAPPQVQDKGTSSVHISHAFHVDNIILAQPTQTLNQEVSANIDPLNVMDEDLIEELIENDYKDSQDIPVDEEKMTDTFLNLDHIQDFGYVI